jgi:hypothetical protein
VLLLRNKACVSERLPAYNGWRVRFDVSPHPCIQFVEEMPIREKSGGGVHVSKVSVISRCRRCLSIFYIQSQGFRKTAVPLPWVGGTLIAQPVD